MNYECSSVDPAVTTCTDSVITVALDAVSPMGNDPVYWLQGGTGDTQFPSLTMNELVTGGTAQVVFTAPHPIAVGTTGQLVVRVVPATGEVPDNSLITATATYTSTSAALPAVAAATPIQWDSVLDAGLTLALVRPAGDPTWLPTLDQNVIYRVQLTTPGNVTWYPAIVSTIVEPLPVGAVYVSSTGGGVYDALTHTVTWTTSGIGYDRTVTLRYPSTDFAYTDVVTNEATLNSTGRIDPVPVIRDATVTHGFVPPLYRAAYAKTPYNHTASMNFASQRQGKDSDYIYQHSVTNTGNVPIGGTLSDEAPCRNATPATSADHPDLTPCAPAFDLRIFSAWTSGAPWPAGTTVSWTGSNGQSYSTLFDTAPFGSVPASSLWNRAGIYTNLPTIMDYEITLPDGYLAVGATWSIRVDGRLVGGWSYPFDTQVNKGSYTIDFPGGSATVSDDATMYFREPIADLRLAKSADKNLVRPGDTVTWTIRMTNAGVGSAYIDNIPLYLIDTLPAGLTVVPGSERVMHVQGGTTATPTSTPVTGSAFNTANANITYTGATGRTMTVRFTKDPTQTANPGLPLNTSVFLIFTTTIDPGWTGYRENCASFVALAPTPGYTPDSRQDTCRSIQVETYPSATAFKGVKGDRDSGFSYSQGGTTGLGHSSPGGYATWEVNWRNTGNVPLTNVVIYDVFPHVGDTGITAEQVGTPRGSAYTPRLTGPITGAPAGVVVTYSTSTNPCRPELIAAGPVGCDDTWVASPTNWADVSAVRIAGGSTQFAGGSGITFSFPTQVPTTAAVGSVAYNSIAFSVTPVGAGATPLLPTEPVKVGLEVQGGELSVLKRDVKGNGGDDDAAPVLLDPRTTTPIEIVVTNSGNDDVDQVVVTDALVSGTGAVTDLLCTFPDGTTGTTWPGPFRSHDEFTCTGTVPALAGGATHHDRVTVTGSTIDPVAPMALTASDDYHARAVALGSLGDLVWLDTNADGVQDAGEPGLPGVLVTLRGTDIFGNAVERDMPSTLLGGYSFADVAPGSYTVGFTPPGGLLATRTGAGTDATDSDGASVDVVLAEGDHLDTIDSGFYSLAVLGDRVWHDLDGDGVQDSGEPGIPGTLVTLNGKVPGGLSVLLTTETDTNGNYVFEGLLPGEYTLTFSPPSTGDRVWRPTALGAGEIGTDSDGVEVTVTLRSGSHDLTLDSGFLLPGAVVGTTWVDADSDGTIDGAESVHGGVTVELLDAAGTVVATATTAADGSYRFDGLLPGAFSVRFTTPTGFTATTPATVSVTVTSDGEARADHGFTAVRTEPTATPTAPTATPTAPTSSPTEPTATPTLPTPSAPGQPSSTPAASSTPTGTATSTATTQPPVAAPADTHQGGGLASTGATVGGAALAALLLLVLGAALVLRRRTAGSEQVVTERR